MIFLRPWAFLLLILPFLIKGVHRLRQAQTPWTKFIDKSLLAALLVKSGNGKFKKRLSWQIIALWGIGCFALAGPSLYKLPTPAVESAPNTVIVFDLSLEGKALLQGQAKLYDLLNALRKERVGLVVFGQNQGYTAMPLTPDILLVKEIVPTLSADVLPEPALNPKAGFEYAAQLLDNAGGKGRILYITDAPKTWKGRYPFAVLDLNNRSADDSDIQHLLTTTQRGESTQRENAFSGNADVWADLGGWVVLFFLPFFALLFRKGVLFLIFFLFAIEGEAGFLWRADQEIYHTQKKGVEAYQNREYQSASRLFQQAGHLYNLGNALAFSGDIQGAIEAYQKELEKNPDNQDALFNKEYLEKQLPPPEEPQKQSEEGESKDNKSNTNEDSDKNQQGNRQQESEQQSEAENQADKNQTPENNEQGTHQSDTQPTQDETQEELEKALAEYEKEAPYNQEEQQIINRLNHDPSRVLRYRLMLQHQKGQRK